MSNAARRAGEISFSLAKPVPDLRMHPVDKVAYRNSFAGFGLDLDQSQGRLLATTNNQFVSTSNNHVAWRCIRAGCGYFGTPDGEAFPVEAGVSIGPRLKPANATLDYGRALRPVDP